MKKMFVLILTLALLLSVTGVAALAEESEGGSGNASWPVIELNGTAAELMPSETSKTFRYQTFSGPGREYSQGGAYLPTKVSVKALCRENDYTFIDVEYSVGRRCVYLDSKYVIGADVGENEVTRVSATTKTSICPMYYGPGNQYDEVTQRMKSKYADTPMDELMEIFKGDLHKIKIALQDIFPRVELPGGARVNVLYEVNGWVCIESDCTILGKARTWIPADQVTPE